MTDSLLTFQAANDAEPREQDLAITKLIDALVPGFAPEFDPEEATRLGAFQEDALTEHDALESAIDPVQ